MKEPDVSDPNGVYSRFSLFCMHLGAEAASQHASFWRNFLFDFMRGMTPERICLAALKVVGIEVES